ncbi:MAG: hypothetical protein ACK4ND_17415 [Cytophagaceae bacterium]
MDIHHDLRQQKFYSIIKGTEYSLEYNEIEARLWEFHCPYLPDNKKEKEVLDTLIEYAIYYMKRNDIHMLEVGSCEHVKDYMERKEELRYLIEK